MKHIKFLGYEFDENDFLVEHFEYLDTPYDLVHNGNEFAKMDAEAFHDMMTKALEVEAK